MAWRFEVFDETFREAELTLGQAERVEDLMSHIDAAGNAVRPSWNDVHPLRSAKAARRLAAVMYADRLQIPVADAMSKIADLQVLQFIDEVSLNDSDDLPTVMENGSPLSGAEDSTTS